MKEFPAWASLWSVLILAVAAGACGTGPTAPDPVLFEDMTWKLESLSLSDGSTVTIQEPDKFTALFASDGRLHAGADCNICNGSYESEGESISVGLLACTRVYCASAPLDTDYVGALQAATTISMSDGKLLLHGPNASLTFRR